MELSGGVSNTVVAKEKHNINYFVDSGNQSPFLF